MMKKFFAVLATSVLLTACGDNTPVQTVQWYKENDDARKDMIAKCNNDRNTKDTAPNCVNAEQAQLEKENSRRGVVRLPLNQLLKQEE